MDDRTARPMDIRLQGSDQEAGGWKTGHETHQNASRVGFGGP